MSGFRRSWIRPTELLAKASRPGSDQVASRVTKAGRVFMGNVIPFPPGGRRGSDKRSESAAQPSASQPAADQPPAQQAKELAGALLDQFGGPRSALSAILGDADFEDIFRQHPAVPHAGLTERACFIARVDLDHEKPPIWRRLRLASDLTLTQLHEMLQVALGWTDSPPAPLRHGTRRTRPQGAAVPHSVRRRGRRPRHPGSRCPPRSSARPARRPVVL